MFDFTNIAFSKTPFHHCAIANLVPPELGESILSWFEQAEGWEEKSSDFYSLYDMGFAGAPTSDEVVGLGSAQSLAVLREFVSRTFDVELDPVVDIQVQRMVVGNSVGPHNDFSFREQTHRLIIQFNREWQASSGGLLVLISNPARVGMEKDDKIYLPAARSAVAFEISEKSFHAVSEVLAGTRYSLIYSFHAVGGYRGCSAD